RIESPPAHVTINYDDPIDPKGSELRLFDASGAPVATAADAATGDRTASVSPSGDLGPGPYTVGWKSLDATDGHEAEGFYTFVVVGGPVGIINGTAQSSGKAAELMATLTVMPAADGASLL